MKHGVSLSLLAFCGLVSAQVSQGSQGRRHPGYCDMKTGSCWMPNLPQSPEDEKRHAEKLCDERYPCNCLNGGCHRQIDPDTNKHIFVCD